MSERKHGRNATRIGIDKGMYRSGMQHHYIFTVPNQTAWETLLIKWGIY